MHRFSSSARPLTLPALLAALLLAAFVLPALANDATPASVPMQAAQYDQYYPDWCDNTNDDPADDCPDPGQDPQPVPVQPPPPPQPAPTDPTQAPGNDGSDPDWPDWPGRPQPPAWPETPNGEVARIAADGRTAIAPRRSPRLVKNLIHAANRITRKPYKWGGGHARLTDSGYDCSGATSYVLRAAAMVNGSMVSGGYEKWGLKGAGRWVNVYANSGHVFMVIAGLRFDTSGAGESGPRWRSDSRWTKGFKLRHPARY